MLQPNNIIDPNPDYVLGWQDGNPVLSRGPAEIVPVPVSRDITPADWGRQLDGIGSGAVTLTLTSESIAGVLPGSVFARTQSGTGSITVAAGSGITLRGVVVTGAQYGRIEGYQYRGNGEVWVL